MAPLPRSSKHSPLIFTSANPVILVFEKNSKLEPQQFERYLQQDLLTLHGMQGLREIVSPLEREGMIQGNYAYALLGFEQSPHDMQPVLREIQTRLPGHREMKVSLTGSRVCKKMSTERVSMI